MKRVNQKKLYLPFYKRRGRKSLYDFTERSVRTGKTVPRVLSTAFDLGPTQDQEHSLFSHTDLPSSKNVYYSRSFMLRILTELLIGSPT